MTSKDAIVFNIEWTPPKPSEHRSAKQKAEWASKRRFYSCNAEPNKPDVAHYTADGEKVDRPGDELLREQAAARLEIDLSDRLPDKSEACRIDEYITRFNTLGAFNLGGAMTQQEFDEWIAGARKAPGNIWHGVLSLPTWQSKLVAYEDMEKLVRQTFGGFLKNAGFDTSNIALLASMHENTENKHIHFTFYEKAPKYRDSNGNVGYRHDGMIPKQLLREYRMSATVYLDEHKRDLSNYRNAVVQAMRGVPTDKDIYIALCELADKLPTKGRLQYNSDNIAPYREEIDRVAMLLLRKSPEAMAAHRKTLKEIARRGKALSETGTKNEYAKRLTAEYRSRLGNVVLGMVKNYRTVPKSAVRGEPKTRKQHKAAARRRRQHGAKVIQTALRMVSGGGKSVQSDFTRNLEKVEREIEYERAVGSQGNRSEH